MSLLRVALLVLVFSPFAIAQPGVKRWVSLALTPKSGDYTTATSRTSAEAAADAALSALATKDPLAVKCYGQFGQTLGLTTHCTYEAALAYCEQCISLARGSKSPPLLGEPFSIECGENADKAKEAALAHCHGAGCAVVTTYCAP